jgi:hypothetical protein
MAGIGHSIDGICGQIGLAGGGPHGGCKGPSLSFRNRFSRGSYKIKPTGFC